MWRWETEERRGIKIESPIVLAHAEHAVNLGNAEPVKDVRHKGLKPHVLNARNVFCPLEVVRCAVLASLPGIVHHCRREISSVEAKNLQFWNESEYCRTILEHVSLLWPIRFTHTPPLPTIRKKKRFILALTLVTSPRARPSFRK